MEHKEVQWTQEQDLARLSELFQQGEQVLADFGNIDYKKTPFVPGEKLDPGQEERNRKLTLLEGSVKKKLGNLDALLARTNDILQAVSKSGKKGLKDMKLFPERRAQAIIHEAVQKRTGLDIHETPRSISPEEELKILIGLLQKEVKNSEYRLLISDLQAGRVDRYLEQVMKKQVELSETKPSSKEDLQAGRMTLANFKQPRLIGEGAMGAVYRSSQKKEIQVAGFPTKKLDIPVALKASKDGKKEGKMEREMAFAKRLRRGILQKGGKEENVPRALPTHLLQVVNPEDYFGFEQGTHILVAPWIEGKFPQEYLQQKPDNQKTREVLKIAKQVAGTLETIHEEGLIHQDIKPDNILVTSEGLARVMDFGEMIDQKEESKKNQEDKYVAGSFIYMPPEAFHSADYTPSEQTDVYSLGMTMYVLLTGTKDPFSGMKNMREAAEKKQTPINYSGPHASIINKAIASDPQLRYKSMKEMLRDLNATLDSITKAEIKKNTQKMAQEQEVAKKAQEEQAKVAAAAKIRATERREIFDEGKYLGKGFANPRVKAEEPTKPEVNQVPEMSDQEAREAFKKRTARAKDFY